MLCCAPSVPSAQVLHLWQDDSDRLSCYLCRREFHWLWTRRYHCSFCGEIFCGNCASSTSPLGLAVEFGYSKAQQMCNNCHTLLVGPLRTIVCGVTVRVETDDGAHPDCTLCLEDWQPLGLLSKLCVEPQVKVYLGDVREVTYQHILPAVIVVCECLVTQNRKYKLTPNRKVSLQVLCEKNGQVLTRETFLLSEDLKRLMKMVRRKVVQ